MGNRFAVRQIKSYVALGGQENAGGIAYEEVFVNSGRLPSSCTHAGWLSE